MSTSTSIEWTDATWSPLRARRRDTGKVGQHCERVSPGCTNCYAATHNRRNLPNGGTGLDYVRGSRDLVETFVDTLVLTQPLSWRAPRRIFVENQSDLFADFYDDEQIDHVFGVMALAPQHTFQVLTKRPDRMRRYLTGEGHKQRWNARGDNLEFEGEEARRSDIRCAMTMIDRDGYNRVGGLRWPLPNVWLGVTAEDQQRADERIPILLDTPAALRFVSFEPLLGPVTTLERAALRGPWDMARGLKLDAMSALDWIIVGGESGAGARACQVPWIRALVDEARWRGTACFVKQLGSKIEERNDLVGDTDAETPRGRRTWPDDTAFEEIEWPTHQGARIRVRTRHPKAGDLSEWPLCVRVREFPEVRRG